MDNISHLLMGIDPNAKIIHQIHIGYINDVYLVRIQETSYVLKVFKKIHSYRCDASGFQWLTA